MDKNWYAVYTKPGLETKVAHVLTKRKISNYHPVNMVQNQRSDSKKIIYKPLFTSFVFVLAEENKQTEIKNIGGVINFVYWLSKPAIIDHEEINTIKTFLNEYENIQLVKTNLKSDDLGTVQNDSRMNQEGNIISVSGEMITGILPSLGYIMKASIRKQNVKLIIKNHSGRYTTS
jgi:transcription antitermination factor NusG